MFIAVEGCIAAGKTTVATGLASHRGSRPLIEDFEMNPFLREFYQHPVETATETEFSFLLVHYHQLRKESERSKAEEIVADFHLGKDLIFAEMNMSDQEELEIFRHLNSFCTRRTSRPDILVFLSTPSDTIWHRVWERGREFERQIGPSYYEQLNARYEEFSKSYEGPQIRLEMAEWDFIRHPELFVRLSAMIDTMSEALGERKCGT